MDFDVIILAGGKSRRMGRDKAAIELAGKTLLEHAVDNARSWGNGQVLVAGPPREWLRAEYVPDPPGYAASSLLGIYAGMIASSRPWRLVCGCDMPFIRKDVIEQLWIAKNSGGSAAMWNNRLQPLPGIYPREAEGIIEAMLAEDRYHLANLLDRLEPAILSQAEVAFCDPQGLSFFNINSPEELAMAHRIAGME